MSLYSGTRLGPYEILESLGQGGMGEVYRARDSRLGREVAVKTLPVDFARDPERLARFEREARLLAALNHPNIAAIFGLEECGGVRLLVLELVPGATLAERVAGGALELADALSIARQIAEALEAAHEKGIVHRDLKPANVKVTPEGKVKLLDFGLAKAAATEAPGSDLSRSPTVTSAATEAGVILGTAAYMSPEQARGKPIDRRTDIWSFGCVLFETLTGRKAFEGDTVSDMLAAILRSEPDWESLPSTTPERIRVLLARCLRKEPERRLRDIGDARIEIEEALAEARKPGPPRAPSTGPARPLARFLVTLPNEAPLTPEKQIAVAISPDGASLAYVARRGHSTQLYVRPMDRIEVRPLEGTEGAQGPFFSPDGRWVGFESGGKLKKTSIAGGTPLDICEAFESRGACWGPDDTILFAQTASSGLSRVPASGGEVVPITRLDLDSEETTHRWPDVLPGDNVLFTIATQGIASFDDASIAVQSLKTGERRLLVRGGTCARWAPTGHLVYARGGSLLAAPFHPARPAVGAPSVRILEGVLTEATGAAHFGFSRAGSLVHVPGGAQEVRHTLLWVDRGGAEESLPLPPRLYEEPRFSPDGQRLVLAIGGATHDVWVYDIARGVLARLTFEANNFSPVWTPDGRRITFSSNRNAPADLFWKAADGSGSDERLFANEYEKVPGSWSPDGRVLAFTEYHPTTGADIWVLSLEADRAPRPFLRTRFNEYAPMFSPNGRWLAYTSDESGRDEVYVTSFPEPGEKWQISSAGGAEPVWAPDRQELFYRDEDRVMSVTVQTDPAFGASAPRLLFERGHARRNVGIGPTGLPNYDVRRGGRFVMITESEERPAPTELSVTLEWFADLERRVPPAGA